MKSKEPKCRWGKLKTPSGKRICRKRPGAGARKRAALKRFASK